MNEFKPLLQEITKQLETSVKAVILAKSNSLAGSDLVKSIEFKQENNSLVMWANDYYQYVDKGRRKGVKKVPISALLDFIKKRNLKGRTGNKTMSDIQLAFAIQTSIFKLGIQGKFFDVKVDSTIDQAVDVILDDKALDVLTSQLDKEFK